MQFKYPQLSEYIERRYNLLVSTIHMQGCMLFQKPGAAGAPGQEKL